MNIVTYKYRVKGKRSERALKRHAWTVNRVWNQCVEYQKQSRKRYIDGTSPRWMSRFDLQKLMSGISKTIGIHVSTIQLVCDQFARSRDSHKKCPRFRKSGGRNRSLGWVPFKKGGYQISPRSITYLGHSFHVFGAHRRQIPNDSRNGCFVEDASGRWFVCVQVEAEDRPTGNWAVGVDLGLITLATTSGGQKIDNIRPLAQYASKLAMAQRSRNRQRIRSLHATIRNVRKDHLHKVSTQIARDSFLIAVGNVSSSRLAKTRMAKSVLDAGWSMFRNMLRYKASRHGATYVEVDEKFTSQTCSQCGALPPERPKGIAGLGIRDWVCSFCGVRHDRDVNAARNILKLGLSAQPRDDEKPGCPRALTG